MKDKTTFIYNKDGSVKHKFAYDYSFWSHDGFKVDEKGYSYPEDEDSLYAD